MKAGRGGAVEAVSNLLSQRNMCGLQRAAAEYFSEGAGCVSELQSSPCCDLGR